MNDNPNDKMKLGFDLTDTLKAKSELEKIFAALNKGFSSINLESQHFTREGGQLTLATFKAINTEGRQVVAQLRGAEEALVAFDRAGKLRFASGSGVGRPGALLSAETGSLAAAFKNTGFSYLDDQNIQKEKLNKQAQNEQMNFGKRLAQIENFHQLALQKNEAFNRRIQTQQAQRFIQEQVAQSQALAMNQKFDRKKYLLDWSSAIGEDKFRSAPTYFDKLLNQAAAITTGIVISQAFMRITMEISNAIREAAKFEIKISEIRTLSQQAQQSTQEWSDEILGLSKRFGVNAMDVAEGVYQTLSNQIAHGAETTQFMSEAMKFAAVSLMTTKDAVDLLSSGITSYGQNVSDTSTVAATFFKLIDLGRVRGGELANTIGSVTALTAQLGIPLGDVNASLAVMSNNGVTAANAMTYMRNITTSLLKPSKEMKVLLKEWGVDSGEAAIQTFNLTGVMAKLHEAIGREGFEELAKVEPNVRGLIGTSLLAGQNIGKFTKEIDMFKNSISGYSDKIDIAFESPGKKLEIFWNQLKVFFLEGGMKFVDIVGTIAGKFEDVGESLSTLTKILTVGAVAWATYKLSMGGLDSIVASIVTLFNVLETSMIALHAFMLSNPVTFMVTATAAAITAIYLFSTTYEEQIKKISEASKVEAEKISRVEIEVINRREEKYKQFTQSQIEKTNQATAKMRAGYTEFITTTEEKLKTLEEAVKETADVFKECFGGVLKGLEGKLNKFNSIIRETLNHINSFSKARDNKLFERTIEDMSPFGRVKAEMNRASELKNKGLDLKDEALGLFASGDAEGGDEKLKEARTMLDESFQLIDEAHKERKSMNKDKLSGLNFLDPQTKANMLAQINDKDKVRLEILEREKDLKQEMELLDQSALELARQKAKLAEEEVDKTKKYKIKMFDELKQVDALKITDKDTPDSIAKKMSLINKAQGDISVAGTSFSVSEAVNMNAKLEEKKNLLQGIFDKQEAINKLNEKEKKNTEIINKNQATRSKNAVAQKKDIELLNPAFKEIKKLIDVKSFSRDFGDAGSNIIQGLQDRLETMNDETPMAVKQGIATEILDKMKSLEESYDSMHSKGDYKKAMEDREGFWTPDSIRRLSEIETQAKTLEYYSKDYLERQRQNIDLNKPIQYQQQQQPETQTKNNNVAFGDINVNITTQQGQQIDARQLAIQIRREFMRGTVPALA